MATDRLAEREPATQARHADPRPDAAAEGRPGWLAKAGQTVGAHPKAALVAALSVGVMLGWLIKRR